MLLVPARRFRWDTVERLFWTTLEFAVGLGITEAAELDTWWAAPIGIFLALLKAFAAKTIGQKNTASTLPVTADPAGALPPVTPPAAFQ